MNLPKYRCHKIVEALKIEEVSELKNGGAILEGPSPTIPAGTVPVRQGRQ